jgi:hypothetical protein
VLFGVAGQLDGFGTRPAVCSITISTTRSRSERVSVENSPVDPHGTKP